MEEVAINVGGHRMRDLPSLFDNRSSIQRSVFDEVDKALNGVFGKGFFPEALTKSTYPKMNVYQQDEALHIDAYVPEVQKDKLSLKVDGDILTIEGSVNKEKAVDDTEFYCREVSKRSFSRSIQLPTGAKVGEIKAEHKEGMLKVVMPLPKVEGKKEVNKQIVIE